MENIVLIRPDVDKDYPFGKLPAYLPLGLGSIAGVLKRDGYIVSFVDCYLDGHSPENVLKIVMKENPLFVGISVNIASTKNASLLTRVLTQNGVYVVLGGPQVTVFPEKTMIDSGADVGVIGEGEAAIIDVARNLSSGINDMSKITGLIYRVGAEYKTTEEREPIKDLDSLPFIPWEIFPHMRYAQDTPELERKPFGWISTSRGCPWACNFCSNIHVWGRKYRSMSPKRIVDEIAYLNSELGIKALDFREDNFTVKRDRVLQICQLIKDRGIDVEWMCESRVDIVDNELLSEMYTAGCRAIYFGIESGTQRVLDFLNKGFKLGQAVDALNLCRKNNIRTIASVMIGVPTQTMKENLETIDFLKKIRPDVVYFNAFIGIPGSATYDYIEKKGLVYKRTGDIILANSEFLSWPEKLALKQKAEIAYNLSPRILVGHLRRMGVRRFIKKGTVTFKRYLKSQKTVSL